MPKDVMDFFRASAGRWFSQRNSHHPAGRRFEGGRSELEITPLAPEDGRVAEICRLYRFEAAGVAGAVLVEWKGTIDRDSKTHTGRTILVVVPDAQDPAQGSILQDKPATEPLPARYRVGDDDVLTLSTTSNQGESEERLWFASPNLRLRTAIVRYPDGTRVTTFCSEVRRAEAAASKGERSQSQTTD